MTDRLIEDYRIEIEEDHHSHGSGHYEATVVLPEDISRVLPYLNAVLEDSIYDHQNRILIGISNKRKYAFRPLDIRLGMVGDPSRAPHIAAEAVDLVNRVWAKRGTITPSLKKYKLPPVYDIFKCLPRTNCKRCGTTCLAFAAKLHSGEVRLEDCALLSQPEHAANRQQIAELFRV